MSILAINYLHDVGLLDPGDYAPQERNVVDYTRLDGDIPVRITLQQRWSGPLHIAWELWPGEPGRRTYGAAVLYRFSGPKAILGIGPYDRWGARSDRLRRIPPPDAKWGLTSSEIRRFGISTTY